MKILDYEFEGPYPSTGSLKDRSGVYAVLGNSGNGGYSLIDVGESHEVKSRVENHDRKPCWSHHSKGKLYIAVHYTPGAAQQGRMVIEQKIRRRFNPPCGKM